MNKQFGFASFCILNKAKALSRTNGMTKKEHYNNQEWKKQKDEL